MRYSQLWVQVLEETSDKKGQVGAGTFGPDAIFTFVLFQLAYVSKDPNDGSALRSASFAYHARYSYSALGTKRAEIVEFRPHVAAHVCVVNCSFITATRTGRHRPNRRPRLVVSCAE